MISISLFKVGLISMLFFVLASNVLNYVSIGTGFWSTDGVSWLWKECYSQMTFKPKCFGENPPGLIATGTALNCLSFVLIIVSQLALFAPRFKDSFALYFVIGAEIATLLSLIFNSTGWYFVFYPQYQNLQPNIQPLLNLQNIGYAFKLGWSFWLLAGSFAASVIAAVIGSAILGCTCVWNDFERKRKLERNTVYLTDSHSHTVFNEVLRI